jgi:hypothetical protein
LGGGALACWITDGDDGVDRALILHPPTDLPFKIKCCLLKKNLTNLSKLTEH